MKNNKPHIFLLLSILLICSRGLFELYLPKSIAYITTAIGFTLFSSIHFLINKPSISIDKRTIFTTFSLILCSFISAFLTLTKNGDSTYLIYLTFPITVSGFYFIFSTTKTKTFQPERIATTLTIISAILFTTACLQQVQAISLPGETYTFGTLIRPSSLTGSYLHYPLIMCLLGACIWHLREKITLGVVISFSSVFFSFSRSGMLIILLMGIYLILQNSSTINIRKFRKATLFKFYRILIAIAISLGVMMSLDLYELVIDRLISSTNTSASGNDIRIRAWSEGLSIWYEGNIFFGENFGLKTNLTKNLSDNSTGVVESGVIQNLINLGIIGTAFFYLIFYNLYRTSRSSVIKSFIFAFFIESFVYQSIEVMPLMLGTLLLIPLISRQQISKYS